MNLTNGYVIGSSLNRRNAFYQMLLPSWLSGLVTVTLSLAVVLGSAALAHYQGSTLQFLVALHNSQNHSVQSSYQTVGNNLSASSFISNVPLFIFWGAVGGVAYLFLSNVVNGLYKAKQLRQEMDYVHADSQALLRQAAIHLVVRLGVLLVWFVHIKLTLHVFLPYILAVTYAGAGALNLLVTVGYFVLAISVLAVSLHVHVVLLRLLLLRSRMFGQSS